MPRTPRALLPAGPFHAMSHAVEGQKLFHRPRDFRRYLGLLQLTIERHDWQLFTFALMPNHVHLLVSATPERLSDGFWWLNWSYAEHYKRTHRSRLGHVFSGRPKLKPITSEAYFLAVVRYIALNPAHPDEYHWSAHRAITGTAPPLPMVARDELLKWFGPTNPIDGYERLVRGAEPGEQRAVGRWAGGSADRPLLADLLAGGDPAGMLAAHDTWGYSLREIGAAAGLHHMVVRRAIIREREHRARPPVRDPPRLS